MENIMKIDQYNSMEYINVNSDMVAKHKRIIINYFENNKFFYLANSFVKLHEINELQYYIESYENDIEHLNNKISEFMALQEALFSLMNEGYIMPVKVPFGEYISKHYITINCIERNLNEYSGIISGKIDIYIPIYVHEVFIKKPSLISK